MCTHPPNIILFSVHMMQINKQNPFELSQEIMLDTYVDPVKLIIGKPVYIYINIYNVIIIMNLLGIWIF